MAVSGQNTTVREMLLCVDVLVHAFLSRSWIPKLVVCFFVLVVSDTELKKPQLHLHEVQAFTQG